MSQIELVFHEMYIIHMYNREREKGQPDSPP